MWLLAIIQWAAVIPLVIGIFGVAGIIFTALKFNRDDTSAVVTQQSTILNDMKTLNGELRAAAEDLRKERDDLKSKVDYLTGQVEMLREELRAASQGISGQVSKIQQQLDDEHTAG